MPLFLSHKLHKFSYKFFLTIEQTKLDCTVVSQTEDHDTQGVEIYSRGWECQIVQNDLTFSCILEKSGKSVTQ
jgi:hypothetical protein